MPTTILSDGTLETHGLISNQDILDILAYYNDYFTVSFQKQNQIITKDDWNLLTTTIRKAAGSGWGVTPLPTFPTSLIESSIWPKPKILFQTYEQEFPVGSTTVTIAGGCTAIVLEWIVGGGGGGGPGTETENGGGGGGGGSGGWYENLRYDVNEGDILVFQVGWGGGWSGAGGSSAVLRNGTTIAAVAGGNAGGWAGPWSGGGGGGGGAPNGHAGYNGNEAGDGYGSADGGNGGDGPFGGGGERGYAGSRWPGQNATAYGAGGGGGGSWDRHAPWSFHGGVGGQGYIKVKFLNAIDARS